MMVPLILASSNEMHIFPSEAKLWPSYMQDENDMNKLNVSELFTFIIPEESHEAGKETLNKDSQRTAKEHSNAQDSDIDEFSSY